MNMNTLCSRHGNHTERTLPVNAYIERTIARKIFIIKTKHNTVKGQENSSVRVFVCIKYTFIRVCTRQSAQPLDLLLRQFIVK